MVSLSRSSDFAQPKPKLASFDSCSPQFAGGQLNPHEDQPRSRATRRILNPCDDISRRGGRPFFSCCCWNVAGFSNTHSYRYLSGDLYTGCRYLFFFFFSLAVTVRPNAHVGFQNECHSTTAGGDSQQRGPTSNLLGNGVRGANEVENKEISNGFPRRGHGLKG